MYGMSAEAAEARELTTLEALRRNIGPCREWIAEKHNRCNEPAEYVLWGKLIPAEGLGPRCYDCAAKHVGHSWLGDRAHASIDLGRLAREIDEAHQAAVGWKP